MDDNTPETAKPDALNVWRFHDEIASPRADGTTSNRPLLLAIELTNRCNFRCVHCAQSYASFDNARIEPALLQRLAPLASTAHEIYLFGDGEILLDIPLHLAAIARIQKESPGCMLGFSTNGKLLTADVYELYATAGIGYIQISIDAASHELYNAMRRGGDMAVLEANLEAIAKLRAQAPTPQTELHMATVVSRQNMHELPALADFALRHGINYWYVNAETPMHESRSPLCLSTADIPEVQRLCALVDERLGANLFHVFDPNLGLNGTQPHSWAKPPERVHCSVPWQRLEVKANGDVKVCPYFSQPLCSIQDRSPEEVWNGEEFRALRRSFATHMNLPSCCVNCPHGMRSQYAPGYPGLPERPRVVEAAPSRWPMRWLRTLRQRLR